MKLLIMQFSSGDADSVVKATEEAKKYSFGIMTVEQSVE
jgi:hypothetical protein